MTNLSNLSQTLFPRYSELRQEFKVNGIPSLVVTSGCRVITTSGRQDVTERGTKCFHNWLAAEVL